MFSRDRVANFWRSGMPEQGTNIFTDGEVVFSYRHVIARTVHGLKVAFDCHRTPTTATHASALKRVADAVWPCLSCGQPPPGPGDGG